MAVCIANLWKRPFYELQHSSNWLDETELQLSGQFSFNHVPKAHVDYIEREILRKFSSIILCSMETVQFENTYVYVHVRPVVSVVPNPLWPYGAQAVRFLCPWDSPGRTTGVGCNAFLTQESNPVSPALQADYLPTDPPGKPTYLYMYCIS